jgi:hypothetical protein
MFLGLTNHIKKQTRVAEIIEKYMTRRIRETYNQLGMA